jgi:adenylate kinase
MTDPDSISTPYSTKSTIIGLYDISGSGKTHLLNQLKASDELQNLNFVFYDGSELIDQVTSSGLERFKQLDHDMQRNHVESALNLLSKNCRERNGTAVVVGHYMFWDNKKDPKDVIVGIDKDWETYTSIIYLNTSPHLVAGRIKVDTNKKRDVFAVKDLLERPDKERTELRKICR